VSIDSTELVSVPCDKSYDVWVRDATLGTWKKSPSSPVYVPCVVGSGSTYVEVTRPTW